MTAPYNLTNVTAANNWPELIMGAGLSFTDGWLGVLMLSAIFVMFLIGFKGFEGKKAFASAAFITAICSIFFWLMGLVASYVLVITFVMAGLGVVGLLLE